MSNLDSRIGPRKSPSPEPTHVYNKNKAWLRPGYHPSSPVKKLQRAHHLGPLPSRSDGEPALLSRMDLTDLTYSPTSKRPRSRYRGRHRSGRSLGNLEDSGGLILGNHRVTYSTASEAAITRSPSPVSGVTEHGGTLSPPAYSEAEDPDFIPGLHSRVVDDAAVPESSGCRKSQHGSPIDLVTGLVSQPSDRENSQDRGDLASSWTQPSLKERIAPLVKQNAYLRYMHDRHDEPSKRITPLVHDKSMDAVMTSTFCDSFTKSLITCRSQLAQERPNNAPTIKNSLNSEAHVENLPPPATSKPPLVSSPSTDRSFASGSLFNKTLNKPTVTANQLTQEPSIDTRIAKDNLTVPIPIPIPIPIPSPIVSPQSSVPNSLASPSGMMRERYSSNPQKRSRSPSSSSFTRPHKRPRSRSPPPFRRSQDNGWNSRNRSSRSPPPSYHRLPPSPNTTRRSNSSYTSHHSGSTRRSTSPHTSPHVPHSPRPQYKLRRSRSPYSQRPRSPPSYTQVSPRRLESDTVDNDQWMSDAHRRGHLEEYSGGSSKKRYLTAFEREELEKLKNDGGQGHARSTTLDSSQVEERAQAGSGSFTNPTSNSKHTTLSPVPTNAVASANRQSPRGPAADLIETCQTDQQQYLIANDSGDGAVKNAKSGSPAGSLANVDKAGTILKSDIPTKRALPPWKPFDGVPGIWLLMNGSATPDVCEHSFKINQEVAEEWNLPRVLTNGESMTGTKPRNAQQPSMLSWKLKCVLAESVDVVRQRLERTGTAEQLIQELSRFQDKWPAGGKLIVEVNPTHIHGQTFYSKALDFDVPSVELKHHIHEGTNLIRFIQLGDLSKHVFILYAAPCAGSPHTDSHTLDLDNLRIMLQKSRLNNLPEEPLKQPVFGAHTAHVSVTVNNSS